MWAITFQDVEQYLLGMPCLAYPVANFLKEIQIRFSFAKICDFVFAVTHPISVALMIRLLKWTGYSKLIH